LCGECREFESLWGSSTLCNAHSICHSHDLRTISHDVSIQISAPCTPECVAGLKGGNALIEIRRRHCEERALRYGISIIYIRSGLIASIEATGAGTVARNLISVLRERGCLTDRFPEVWELLDRNLLRYNPESGSVSFSLLRGAISCWNMATRFNGYLV
jgi:hypothetical protein